MCLQGNKGGVSIRFDVGGVNLIIVNTHLAAHLEYMAERIEVRSGLDFFFITCLLVLMVHCFNITESNCSLLVFSVFQACLKTNEVFSVNIIV